MPKKCKKITQKKGADEIISIKEIEDALKILKLEYKSLSAIEIYNLFAFIAQKKES